MEAQAEESRQEFEEKLEHEEDRIKNDATLILKETINIDDLVKASAPDETLEKASEEEVWHLISTFNSMKSTVVIRKRVWD